MVCITDTVVSRSFDLDAMSVLLCAFEKTHYSTCIIKVSYSTLVNVLLFIRLKKHSSFTTTHTVRTGDLHPGNVYVSRDGKNFILFDVGIVAEYTNEDHVAIVSILAEFIRKNGRKAGLLMIDDSNRRLQKERGNNDQQELQQHALQVETFLTKIEYLTIQASGKDYFMQKLGEYISYICQAAATHHVKLNPSFISAALAVKVEEGIALALDPAVEIWKVATPIIIESETRRRISNSLRGGRKSTKKEIPVGDRQGNGDDSENNGNKDSSYLEAALRLLRGEW
jgi:predicted unusual protein kinase regulating ubiquinone biosynthesis (AarF/ABC1/UbiB family)